VGHRPRIDAVPVDDARFRVILGVASTCDAATVLISASHVVGLAYIASGVADQRAGDRTAYTCRIVRQTDDPPPLQQ
jgi:hypothetical protein